MYGKRHTFVLMAFIGFVIHWSLKNCLNIAIVTMVEQSPLQQRQQQTLDLCDFAEHQACPQTANNESQSFNWSPLEQGFVIGSLQIGTTLTLIPGGLLADRYGGKTIIAISTLVAGFLTVCVPVAANLGLPSLIVVRILQGMAQGFILPSMYCMMSEWIPKSERSKMITFIWSGSSIGTSLSHFLSGFLSQNFGWEFTFYLFGFVAILFVLVWNQICFDSPDTHPDIQENELKLIVSDLPKKRHDQTTARYVKRKSPPMFQMIYSAPVLALIFATFGFGWAYFTLLNQAPIYMHTVLHVCPTAVIQI